MGVEVHPAFHRHRPAEILGERFGGDLGLAGEGEEIAHIGEPGLRAEDRGSPAGEVGLVEPGLVGRGAGGGEARVRGVEVDVDPGQVSGVGSKLPIRRAERRGGRLERVGEAADLGVCAHSPHRGGERAGEPALAEEEVGDRAVGTGGVAGDGPEIGRGSVAGAGDHLAQAVGVIDGAQLDAADDRAPVGPPVEERRDRRGAVGVPDVEVAVPGERASGDVDQRIVRLRIEGVGGVPAAVGDHEHESARGRGGLGPAGEPGREAR